MATENTEVNVSSDSYFDFTCKQCSRLGNNSEASNYCEDCKEYVCRRCTAYHKVLPITKHHEVITLVEKNGTFVFDIETSTPGDECWIIGLAMLPNNKRVAAQYDRCKLKIIDTVKRQLISEILMPAPPVDVAKTSADTVVVALPDEHKIIFVRIVQSLAIVKGFKVTGECTGVSYNADRSWLALSFCQPPKVELVDLTGHVIRSIALSGTQQLFVRPQKIVFSKDNKAIYVSDDNEAVQAIVKTNLDGKLLAKRTDLTDQNLRQPRGMVACKNGEVYFTDSVFSGPSIYVLSADCNSIKSLLNKKDLERLGGVHPGCLKISEQEDMLYVGAYGRSTIADFKLK